MTVATKGMMGAYSRACTSTSAPTGSMSREKLSQSPAAQVERAR